MSHFEKKKGKSSTISALEIFNYEIKSFEKVI
jgi:hypothetical protein